jgi:hypothetical protein
MTKWQTRRACGLGGVLLAMTVGAAAQYAYVPTPLQLPPPPDSQAQTPEAYAVDAARVIYNSYPMQVARSASLEKVLNKARVEIEIGADGLLVSARLSPAPTSEAAGKWVLALLGRVARFPVPLKLQALSYTEVWLLDETGQFRLSSMGRDSTHDLLR